MAKMEACSLDDPYRLLSKSCTMETQQTHYDLIFTRIMHLQENELRTTEEENARVASATKDMHPVDAVWSQQCLPMVGDWFSATENHGNAYFWTGPVSSKNSIRFVRRGKRNLEPFETEMHINMYQKWEVLALRRIAAHGGIYFSARTRIPEWDEEVYINLMMIDTNKNTRVPEWH